MSPSPPNRPDDLPASAVEPLDDLSAAALRRLAEYATDLAAHRERDANASEREAETHSDEPVDDRPDSVPSKATITVKEINDNRYYYWQWREGEKIKSEYKGPVSAEE